MSNSISNLMGMLIAILGGTFFFIAYCSECQGQDGMTLNESTESTLNSEIRANLTEQHSSARTERSSGAKIHHKNVIKDSLVNGVAPGSQALSGIQRHPPGT